MKLKKSKKISAIGNTTSGIFKEIKIMKAPLKSGAFFVYFCTVKWIGNRISFNDQKDKTTIVIDPSKNAWISAIMGAWLGMWYAIGATVMWALYVMKLKEQEKLILWIFLVFWLYYAWRVTMSFFWNLRGQEYIKINADAFYLKKSFFPFSNYFLG
jgi:hypothetical protein